MSDAKPTPSKKEEDKTVTKELKDTFPASDPLASTQPGGGITGTEPPPKGSAHKDAAKS